MACHDPAPTVTGLQSRFHFVRTPPPPFMDTFPLPPATPAPPEHSVQAAALRPPRLACTPCPCIASSLALCKQHIVPSAFSASCCSLGGVTMPSPPPPRYQKLKYLRKALAARPVLYPALQRAALCAALPRVPSAAAAVPGAGCCCRRWQQAEPWGGSSLVPASKPNAWTAHTGQASDHRVVHV